MIEMVKTVEVDVLVTSLLLRDSHYDVLRGLL